jgi:hypothetical protein
MTQLNVPALDPVDDLVHTPPPGVDRWTENIQWNVRDDAGLGVIWHAGTMLDDPRLWHVVVALTLPDGSAYAAKMVAPGDDGFGPANAQLATVEPYERWRFRFLAGMVEVSPTQRASGLVPDGHHLPVEIDLDLSAAYPVWIPEGSTAHGDWGRFHHEQAVRAAGTIRVNGEVFELDGIGHRDHSMGPRDMSRLRRAYWGNGIFESGWGFATMQGDYVDSDFQRAALFDEHGTHPATMKNWARLEESTGEPHEFVLELDIDGRQVSMTGRTRAGMNFTVVDGAEFSLGTDLDHPERYVLSCLFVDWSCDGERGIGYLDRGALSSLLRRQS